MSQTSKQVEWCLRKAEKEIEECKKLGKRAKHRGLLKVETNLEEAKNHIKKAEENLNVVTSFDKNNFGFIVISSLFYSMYHCFLAIAAKFGYESGNQTCTIALIEHLIEEKKINLDSKFVDIMKYKDEQTNQQYPSIIDMREDYTYSAKVSVEKEKIEELITLCQELLEKTKEIVYDNL